MAHQYFSLGDNFPKVIGDIAQEHLLYHYDIEKAIHTFTEAFGMDKELAKQLLFGKDLVIRMDGTDSIIVTEREDVDIFPQINPKEYIIWVFNEMKNEAEHLASIIKDIKANDTDNLIGKFYQLDHLLENSGNTEMINFANQLMQEHINLYSEDSDEEDQQYSYIKSLQYIAAWKDTTYKRLKVIQFMLDNKWITPDEIAHDIEEEIIFNDFYSDFSYVCIGYQSIMQSDKKECESFADLLNVFKQISEYTTELKPTDINDKKDAYWLSPEGKLYGLRGDYNSLLHLQIAEMLDKHNIIDVPDNDRHTPEIVLEREGWVKIHHDFIEFDPYMHATNYTTDVKYITEKQVQVISEYLKLHYGGWGRIGYEQKKISYVTFKAMDDVMRNKLFRYF